MQVQTRGEFGGLGIEVTQENGYIKVISPIDDTPAARAGVQAGRPHHPPQRQVRAGPDPAGGGGADARRARHRDPLTIRREGADKPIELSLTRDVIRPQVVRFRMEGDDIGYIRLTSFNEQTEAGAAPRHAARCASRPGGKLRGMVLDLRNNPGGLLDQAVQVADDFLDQGEIVSTRARRHARTRSAGTPSRATSPRACRSWC